MAKQVRYLRQVVSHLEEKYGSEKAQAIMEKALKRYDDLIEENKDEPKAYYMHTRERIYPSLCSTRCLPKALSERKQKIS